MRIPGEYLKMRGENPDGFQVQGAVNGRVSAMDAPTGLEYKVQHPHILPTLFLLQKEALEAIQNGPVVTDADRRRVQEIVAASALAESAM